MMYVDRLMAEEEKEVVKEEEEIERGDKEGIARGDKRRGLMRVVINKERGRERERGLIYGRKREGD